MHLRTADLDTTLRPAARQRETEVPPDQHRARDFEREVAEVSLGQGELALMGEAVIGAEITDDIPWYTTIVAKTYEKGSKKSLERMRTCFRGEWSLVHRA